MMVYHQMKGNYHMICLLVLNMADEQTTKDIAYIILAISFLVMLWFIVKQGKQNRVDTMESNSPKIAGSDDRPGGAKNPEQFDDPDDDALDEMADLLDDFED
jgi:hypothetical protein